MEVVMSSRLAILVVVGVFVVPFAANASTATLPNPCGLLAKVHAEKALGKGSVAVKPGKLTRSGSGSGASSTCAEMVGTLSVFLTFSHSAGGFGGLTITSKTHPSGLGSGDELVVGSSPSGSPVDFIVFHKKTVFVDLSANGAAPSHITTLARQIYKLLH